VKKLSKSLYFRELQLKVWGGENNFNTTVHERTVDIYIPFLAVTIFHQPNSVHTMGQGIFASELGKVTALKDE
jgi:hypothetical protein